jgi:hypothetical protein
VSSRNNCEYGMFAILGIGQTLAMDAKEQLKDDVRAGLIDLIIALQQRFAELEKQLASSPTVKVDEPYPMKAEEKRQQARHPKKPSRRSITSGVGSPRKRRSNKPNAPRTSFPRVWARTTASSRIRVGRDR